MYPPIPSNLLKQRAELSNWKRKTISEWLFEFCGLYGSRIALQDEAHSFTYTQLAEKIDARAAYFVSLGISKNDRVTMRLRNRVDFFVCFFALMRIGAIPVLALPAHSINEVIGVIQDSASVAYIGHYTDEPHEELILNWLDKSEHVKNILLDVLPAKQLMSTSLHPLAPANNQSLSEIELLSKNSEPEEVAFILLSGGTTGRSKLIPRTHSDYIYNVEMMSAHSYLDGSVRYLAALPVAHNFALGCPGVLGVLANGGTAYLGDANNILSLITIVDTYSITHTALVPSLADMFVESKKLGVSEFPSLKQIQVGGAYFAPDKAKSVIDELKCELQQVFGMSEGLLCCSKRGDSLDQIIHSQGSPASSEDRIRIVSSDLEDVAAGEVGELLAKGPYTIHGYLFNEQANQKDFTTDGWFITGDLARRRADGNIQIMGRVKEQINRFGEKFSPTDVEDLLRKGNKIIQSCLIAVPCSEQGEKTVLFVVNQSDLSESDVRKQLLEHNLSNYKLPDEIKLISQLPLTPIGKTDKHQLIKLYEV
ncbi:AMP-binding protein [Pseudoalteromonas ostreae]|uniref:AMP-binding protein n=1 Tax=Pseudoalteromonas ostreae TaxID=2774154 RepID=UPI001B363BD3|nr:AMP-binding protein [Pseudoalteromonas ostreae]